jgi:regulatory protein
MGTIYMDKPEPRKLDGGGLFEYALRVLAGRAHSIGELREKLRRRAARVTDIEDVLARLKDCGYLDDRRFAEAFAAARLANDRLGRTRVLQDLRHRRVAPALAERTVQQLYSAVDEEAMIEEWIRRKYRLVPHDTLFQEDKDVAAAYRRLLRAGFRPGEVIRALKRFAKNPELLDQLEPPQEEPE